MALQASNFEVVQAQAVIFTPGLHFDAQAVLASFVPRWVHTFNGAIVQLPAPPEAPPDLPRVIAKSMDSLRQANFSPARLDLFWLKQGPQTPFDPAGFTDLCCRLFNDYRRFSEATVGRLACVLTRVAAQENPAVALAQHFCQDRWLQGPLNRPAEFEIHAQKQFALAGRFTVNSWFRCRTASLQRTLGAQALSEPVVAVEQDFNTPAEDLLHGGSFEMSEIEAFFPAALTEQNKVLEMYFPEVQADAS